MKISKNELTDIIKETANKETKVKKLLLTEVEGTGVKKFTDSFVQGFKKGREKHAARQAKKNLEKHMGVMAEELENMQTDLAERTEIQKKFNNTIATKVSEIEEALEEIISKLDQSDETDVADTDVVDTVGSYELEPEELAEMIREEIFKILKEEK